MNILFVCSRNQWRSPTAETIYKNINDLNVKSAGTEPSAKVVMNERHLFWADIIFVMEKKHKQRIIQKFKFNVDISKIFVLDIPDLYQFMDEELIEDIKTKVDSYLL